MTLADAYIVHEVQRDRSLCLKCCLTFRLMSGTVDKMTPPVFIVFFHPFMFVYLFLFEFIETKYNCLCHF